MHAAPNAMSGDRVAEHEFIDIVGPMGRGSPRTWCECFGIHNLFVNHASKPMPAGLAAREVADALNDAAVLYPKHERRAAKDSDHTSDPSRRTRWSSSGPNDWAPNRSMRMPAGSSRRTR